MMRQLCAAVMHFICVAQNVGLSKYIHKEQFSCPNCRADIAANDFIDLRAQDQSDRNLVEEQRAQAISEYFKYHIGESNKPTTKKDLYYLLEYEGGVIRSILSTTDEKLERKIFKANLET